MFDDRYEITTINRPAVRLTALVMALPLILLAGVALANIPETIPRGDGSDVHIPNPDYHPEPAPKPDTPKADKSDPVSLHKSVPKQQVYICKRTGLRYATKAEALRACKPVVKRKAVKARKAVCK